MVMKHKKETHTKCPVLPLSRGKPWQTLVANKTGLFLNYRLRNWGKGVRGVSCVWNDTPISRTRIQAQIFWLRFTLQPPLTQVGWYWTKEYSLTVLEARSPKWVSWNWNQGISRVYHLWMPAVLRLWPHSFNLCFHGHTVLSSSLCVKSASTSF